MSALAPSAVRAAGPGVAVLVLALGLLLASCSSFGGAVDTQDALADAGFSDGERRLQLLRRFRRAGGHRRPGASGGRRGLAGRAGRGRGLDELPAAVRRPRIVLTGDFEGYETFYTYDELYELFGPRPAGFDERSIGDDFARSGLIAAVVIGVGLLVFVAVAVVAVILIVRARKRRGTTLPPPWPPRSGSSQWPPWASRRRVSNRRPQGGADRRTVRVTVRASPASPARSPGRRHPGSTGCLQPSRPQRPDSAGSGALPVIQTPVRCRPRPTPRPVLPARPGRRRGRPFGRPAPRGSGRARAGCGSRPAGPGPRC